MIDYRNVIVKKPWGFEYLVYENSTVGLWYLHIDGGKRTSLHCHPRKKTGLVLLSGRAELSFLTDSIQLQPLSKSMIRAGLFHCTEATATEGAELLEIETPRDKDNLVRLEDLYGRKGKAYEGPEAIVQATTATLRLEEPQPESGAPTQRTIYGCLLSMEKIKNVSDFKGRDPHEIIIVLAGGLASDSGDSILGPGDIVNVATIVRLTETFQAPEGVLFLAIRKATGASAETA